MGVNHDVTIPGIELFFAGIHTLGGPAPVRRFLPDLIRLIWDPRAASANSWTCCCADGTWCNMFIATDGSRAAAPRAWA